MKNNKLLLSGLALFSLSATAQQLQNGDILWPNSQKLYQYIQNWTPGQPVKIESTESADPSASGIDFEDENFFISRVKLRPLFRNVKTQINESLNETNDKKLVNWVPVNQADGVHTDALPNALFDSEVFSNWSYVTHWGDWISPHGWVPAALADAAHKHGVLVSGVASIPYGGIGGDWQTAMQQLGNLNDNEQNKEKLAQFLYYHGVDGLGYNSEFNGLASSYITKIQELHKYLMSWMQGKGNAFENMWYDGTNDAGNITFDQGLRDANAGNFSGASLFFNYNWNKSDLLSSSVTYAGNMNPARSSLDLYAGHNMQGGEPGSNNWRLLAQYPISIGLWGAHNTNMAWAQRSANGSAPTTLQDTYQKRNEQWYSNAHRNPVKKMEIEDRAKFQPDETWFGMSVYMSARSSLSWDLDQEPFISYFNLGNGTFLNWKGERMNNNEWYNLGVQDYMPTWRWWFTNKFLGKEITDVPDSGLDAQFVWSDAWLGGSCLNIFGSTPEEYLHLFKTRFELAAGDVITVRYKLLGGKADAKLIFSLEGSEDEPIEFELFDTDQEIDDEWVTYTVDASGRNGLANQTIAMIALGFENAEDMNLNIGELSIIRTQTPTPKKPQITKARILRNNYYGVDAKVIFNMENEKAAGEPCYNLDVNTSLFKLYAKVNGEEKLMGITSSWAGLMFSIPVDDAESIQLGVSAVSTDMKSESEIAWSEDLDLGEREVIGDIVLSQNVIKPNEPFSVGYLDPDHDAAKWEITNAKTGTVLRTEDSATKVEFTSGISEVAPYNVKVTENGDSIREFNWMIQITDEKAGAMPKIYTVSLNDGTEAVTIEPGESVNVAYTGRNADGSATRAISSEEAWVGGKIGDTGLSYSSYPSFTLACWMKYTEIPDGSCSLLSIENRQDSWPLNNWGWFWSNMNPDGSVQSFTTRFDNAAAGYQLQYTLPDTKIPLDTWTHVAVVFEYNGNRSMRILLYINGVKQSSTWKVVNNNNGRQYSAGTTDDFASNPTSAYSLRAQDYYAFFGARGATPIPGNGYVDDLQVWSKALSQEEIEASMNMTRDKVSEYPELLGYWDFESYTDLRGDNWFQSVGNNTSSTASQFALIAGSGEGQATQTAKAPVFSAGNPFLEGSGYSVETKPSWSGSKAIVTETQGTGESGSAKVTYNKAGEYTLTLKLSNDYGEATQDYPLVTVEDPTTGIEGIAAESELRTYTVNDALYVAFASNGDYEVSVYNIAGAMVAHQNQSAVSGQTMRITLGTPGVYVVRVVKDGNEVKAFKVLRK